jgi:hypothetical protein
MRPLFFSGALTMPEIGDIITFYYGRDSHKWRIGKVVAIRDIVGEPLSDNTLYRGAGVKRTRHLVTCIMADKTFRSFYLDGTKWRKVGAIRRKLLQYGGITFEAT